jgi:hypothetical protein
MEFFAAFYSENSAERYQFLWRATGEYAWSFWLMMVCNLVVPQLLWFRAVRRSALGLLAVGLAVNVGMWFERFVIVSLTMMRDRVPATWGDYAFTAFDWMVLLGSFGMFATMFLVFVRVAPAVSIAELKAMVLRKPRSGGGDHA